MMSDLAAEMGLLVISLALWLGRRRLHQKNSGPPARRFLVEQGSVFAGLARFFYFVGLPYLALIAGLLPARFLGLRGLEYFILIDGGSDLWLQLQQALTLSLLTWLLDSRPLIIAGLMALFLLSVVKAILVRQGVQLRAFRKSTLDILYDGLHWAFYRAIFWSMTNDLYLGTVLGSGFVLLEAVLGYRVQRRRPFEQQLFLVNTMILLLTSAVFYYAPNLWLLLIVHAAMVAVINWQPITAAVEPSVPLESGNRL